MTAPMDTCDACTKTYPGLSFVIPSDAWLRISDGVRYLCLWCAADRLAALGLHVPVTINFCRAGLAGTNHTVLGHFEVIDAYLARIRFLEESKTT